MPSCCELKIYSQQLGKQTSASKPYTTNIEITIESVKPGIRYILQKSLNDKNFPNNWKAGKLKTTVKRGKPVVE